MNEYEADLTIDKDRLDVEWLRQAELFGKYAGKQAEARRKVNSLEQQLKVLRSKLILEARENGAKNSSQEEAYYRINPEHQKLKDELIFAQYEQDIAEGAVFAFHQKKTALEGLVTLHGQRYWAGPSVPRAIGEGWARETEAKAVVEKIKARKIAREG